MRNSILKIQERLGGLQTKMALQELTHERFYECFEILLKYYDKTYQFGLAKRAPETIFHLNLTGLNAKENAKNLVDFARTII
ncbi:MAG: hypothetical protein HYZ54_02685 [Ignavibacteriae bacterium]|nr:hypothetical protein [Ignavibacteriota bacterium]